MSAADKNPQQQAAAELAAALARNAEAARQAEEAAKRLHELLGGQQ